MERLVPLPALAGLTTAAVVILRKQQIDLETVRTQVDA